MNHCCQYFTHSLRSTACLIALTTTTFVGRNELWAELSPKKALLESQADSLQVPSGQDDFNWDETESLKIFGLAQKCLTKEDNKGALREFSEILEFFPNTSIWPKTCLEIFYIHLKNNHTDAAEQILVRLMEKEKLPTELSMSLLFAQWDLYTHHKNQSHLNAWILKRNSEEKKKLRTSPDFIQRLKQNLRDKTRPFIDIIQLWIDLEPPRPMESFIHLHQPEKGFTFSRDQMNVLLTRLLINFTPVTSNGLISRVMTIMGENGWAADAHQCFLENSQHAELHQIWVRFLLKHLLFSDALKTIERVIDHQQDKSKALNKHDFSLEIIEANIGLQQWNEAAAAAKNEGAWIFSALSYPMTLQLLKGLHRQAHLQIQIDDLYAIMNPNLKSMIQVELEDNDERKEKQLQELLTSNSLYCIRAAELLNNMYMAQRDQKKLSFLLHKLEQIQPQARATLSIIRKSINTLKELQPSKTPTQSDLDKK